MKRSDDLSLGRFSERIDVVRSVLWAGGGAAPRYLLLGNRQGYGG